VRHTLWGKYFGEHTVGNCYVCSKKTEVKKVLYDNRKMIKLKVKFFQKDVFLHYTARFL
jgi:hypothetical protein